MNTLVHELWSERHSGCEEKMDCGSPDQVRGKLHPQ
jgi:hypothetical protein